MNSASLMLLGWALEVVFGWPDWLYRTVRHPVVWFGYLVRQCDKALNRPGFSHTFRYATGIATALLLVLTATGLAIGITTALPDSIAGKAVEALIVSSLIASRSLYHHVATVVRPLTTNDLNGARNAVSRIVGRNPSQLEESGIARAALESLAENASDGITAPLFWGALFGLPGIAAYKAINTLDSMIGHKNARHGAFGGFAARLDDVANFIPARLTGLLIAVMSGKRQSFRVMLQDARHHRSPNAGWPEAAMAGALGVRLSGPRTYGGSPSMEPWLNKHAPDPSAEDLSRGLQLYIRAMALGSVLLGFAALVMGVT